MERDFPGIPVLNRGFGGSELSDCVRLLPQLVFPYCPSHIVLYAGDNDLELGKSPDGIAELLGRLFLEVRRELGNVHLTYLSIKPSPARLRLMESFRKANQLTHDLIALAEDATFVDVFEPMLATDGQPRRELYMPDGLHLSRTGYRLWKEEILEHHPAW